MSEQTNKKSENYRWLIRFFTCIQLLCGLVLLLMLILIGIRFSLEQQLPFPGPIIGERIMMQSKIKDQPIDHFVPYANDLDSLLEKKKIIGIWAGAAGVLLFTSLCAGKVARGLKAASNIDAG